MLNDVTVFNIREYLFAKGDKDLGEDELRQLLSEFFCDKNPDVERFLKEQSIEFTKKNQSVTYLVFSNEDASLVGYFTITIKPITVNAENFSNTMKRKIARVSELDEENGTCVTARLYICCFSNQILSISPWYQIVRSIV